MKLILSNPDTGTQSALIIQTDVATGVASPAVDLKPGQDATIEVLAASSITLMVGDIHITSDDNQPLVPNAPVITGDPIPEAGGPAAEDASKADADPQPDAAATPVIPPTTDAVLSTDVYHGATADQPVLITQNDGGGTIVTTVTGGTVDPGTVTVAPDGTPTAPGATLGSSVDVTGDVPTPSDAAASVTVTPVGAPQATDGTTPAPTALGDATGVTPITEDDAVTAAADHPDATDATVVSVIKSLEETDEAFTEQGIISIDHLNAALVAAGFAPIGEDHPVLLAAS